MEIEDLPEPDLPEGGALLKMEACAVCGTDIKMLEQGHRDLVYPCIPGHELVGRIAQTDGGDGCCHYRSSASVQEGDLVAVWPGIACGGCLPCRRGDDGRCRDIKIMGFNFPGGFAEMCALPAESLYSGINLLPQGTDPAIASPLRAPRLLHKRPGAGTPLQRRERTHLRRRAHRRIACPPGRQPRRRQYHHLRKAGGQAIHPQEKHQIPRIQSPMRRTRLMWSQPRRTEWVWTSY